MNVLGIETSCDETSVSIVKDGRKILSNQVSSSLKLHKKYGGIVPEIAFRMQLETIAEVAQAALKEACLNLRDVNLVSVANGPGLLGSLLTGISFAKAVSLSLGVPLVGVNHVYSHIYANFLDARRIGFPFIALVVSGGHTSLFYVKDFPSLEILGQTQDDACGEAFDKVAKILGEGYPGGPIIERLARQGDAKKIKFRCSGTRGEFDFSFSGIKTAVLYYVKNQSQDGRCKRKDKYDIAASFQEAVIDALIKKSLQAARFKKVNRLVVGGGVVANNRLRERFYEAVKLEGLDCYFPPKNLCTDNAAMVAGLGFQLFRKGYKAGLDLNVDLN